MARILLLAFLIFLIYLMVRGIARKLARKHEPPPATPPAAGEDMVACARCGVNLPRSSARLEDGKLVCDGNPHCR